MLPSRRALTTVPVLALVALAGCLAGTPAEASVPLPLPSVSPLALPTTLLGVPLPLPSSSPLATPLPTALPTTGLTAPAPVAAPAPAPAPAAGTGTTTAAAPRTPTAPGTARAAAPRTVGSQSVPLALPLAPEAFAPSGGTVLSLPATRLDALDGRAPSVAAPTLAAPLPAPAPSAPVLAIPDSGTSSTSLPPAAVAAAFLALAGAVTAQLRARQQG